MAHKEIKFPKMREARLRYWHGENWTEEDQEKFERARNRRQCLNHRNKHREEYTDYQRCYQQRYRERNRFHYRTYPMEPTPSRQPNDFGRIYTIPKGQRSKEGAKEMNYDVDAYEAAVSQWFEALKDIVANDLLWQHINKYPEKKAFEIKEEIKDEEPKDEKDD